MHNDPDPVASTPDSKELVVRHRRPLIGWAVLLTITAVLLVLMWLNCQYRRMVLKSDFLGTINATSVMVNQYSRYYQSHGVWPAAGTFNSDSQLYYQSTRTLPSAQGGSSTTRIDTYVTEHGSTVELRMEADGQAWCYLP
jgi:hypothetical protein